MSGKSKALPTIVVASAGIAAGAAVAFAGFLLKRRAVRTTCKPFYAEATRRFKIPGISEGFVPQDLFYLSDEQTWLFSGYLANRRPSPSTRWAPTVRCAATRCACPRARCTAVTAPP